jgi:hypothetical protein
MSAPRRPSPARPPLRPDRLRRIERDGFAFLPNRFLRDGFFASLSPHERSLYLFLVLAGDRDGVSFYAYDAICSVLEIPLETYLAARYALIAKDLLAFDGTRFQVLSLPERPVCLAAPPPHLHRRLRARRPCDRARTRPRLPARRRRPTLTRTPALAARVQLIHTGSRSRSRRSAHTRC